MNFERLQFWLWVKAIALVGVLYIVLHLAGCSAVPPRESKPCNEWANGYCTYQEPHEWTRADTRREVGFQVVNALDAIQTSMIRDRADLVEGMPLTRSILGDRPDLGETTLYFASMGVSHYIIARFCRQSGAHGISRERSRSVLTQSGAIACSIGWGADMDTNTVIVLELFQIFGAIIVAYFAWDSGWKSGWEDKGKSMALNDGMFTTEACYNAWRIGGKMLTKTTVESMISSSNESLRNDLGARIRDIERRLANADAAFARLNENLSDLHDTVAGLENAASGPYYSPPTPPTWFSSDDMRLVWNQLNAFLTFEQLNEFRDVMRKAGLCD
jgi:hypothetical protein